MSGRGGAEEPRRRVLPEEIRDVRPGDWFGGLHLGRSRGEVHTVVIADSGGGKG